MSPVSPGVNGAGLEQLVPVPAGPGGAAGDAHERDRGQSAGAAHHVRG